MKLMNMMTFADKQDRETFCVAWLPDGKSFIIRNPDNFTRAVVPKFFKATKFSSFTRKLYRWGFRQVNRGIGPDDPIIFGNDHFQRDSLELMAQMRSITAASIRKQEENNVHWISQKRALESIETEQNAKRMFLMNQLIRQKNAFSTGVLSNSGNMNLSQAMLGNMGRMGNVNMANNGFSLMNQFGGQNPFLGPFTQNSFNSFNGNQSVQGVPHPSSTADIVNAAINALRFAP
jgi:HSF-type DNA-binding